MKRLLALAFGTGALLLYPTLTSAVDPHVLVVDGVEYDNTQESGGSIHWETPGPTALTASFAERAQTWALGDNGSNWLPCEFGIHWVSNENNLVISGCVAPPTTTTTTTTEAPTTTLAPTTLGPTTTTTIAPTTTTCPDCSPGQQTAPSQPSTTTTQPGGGGAGGGGTTTTTLPPTPGQFSLPPVATTTTTTTTTLAPVPVTTPGILPPTGGNARYVTLLAAIVLGVGATSIAIARRRGDH